LGLAGALPEFSVSFRRATKISTFLRKANRNWVNICIESRFDDLAATNRHGFPKEYFFAAAFWQT